jgi:hypothetical protein
VARDPAAQVAVEFPVDEGVEVPAVPQMVESHHGGGNPTHERLLPVE